MVPDPAGTHPKKRMCVCEVPEVDVLMEQERWIQCATCGARYHRLCLGYSEAKWPEGSGPRYCHEEETPSCRLQPLPDSILASMTRFREAETQRRNRPVTLPGEDAMDAHTTEALHELRNFLKRIDAARVVTLGEKAVARRS